MLSLHLFGERVVFGQQLVQPVTGRYVIPTATSATPKEMAACAKNALAVAEVGTDLFMTRTIARRAPDVLSTPT
jgi:hypothetical protein